MANFSHSLREFQRWFPDDAACAEHLICVRWPNGYQMPDLRQDKGLAAAHLPGKAHLCVRRLREGNLGHRRHDNASLASAAQRLVLGGLSDGDSFQRHVGVAVAERTGHLLL